MRQLIRGIILLAGILSCPGFAQAQTWGVHIQVNETYPLGNPEKGYYPILWYSSISGRGVLLGGFGAGISRAAPMNDRWSWRVQLDVARNRYYDRPTIFRDENGSPLGAVIGIATWAQTTVQGVASWRLNRWLALGAGISSQVFVFGHTDYGEAVINGEVQDLRLPLRSHTPVQLQIPLEITSILSPHWHFHVRSSWSITPTSRRPGEEGERWMIATGELVYRWGRKKVRTQ